MVLVQDSVLWIKEKLPEKPKLGIILRQNLEYWLESFPQAVKFPFDQIPHFQSSKMPTRSLNLYYFKLNDIPILATNGRLHYYEGFSMDEITHPIRTMVRLGATTLILTNAAGLVSSTNKVGYFMFLKDYINLMGVSPLRGRIYQDHIRQFPSMVGAYDLNLRETALQVAKELGIASLEGIYAAVSGPAFETPTEISFLRLLGVDAVGMSTVPETQAARQEGAHILAVSVISNLVGKAYLSDAEVLRVAQESGPQMAKFLNSYIERIRELL
jgi:purine-nucleoside phosphorylase